MKKYVSILVVLVLSGFTMYGQSSQSSDTNGASSSSERPQMFEGCLVSHETNYYLVPHNGTAMRLTGDTAQFGEHQGQQVRVHGNQASMTQSSTSGGGNANQEIAVDKIDLMSIHCPTNWNPSEMRRLGHGQEHTTTHTP
jgi:hypothetical protein